MNKIDWRIGQFVQDFSSFESQSKLDASSESDGLFLVAIVDNYKKEDKTLNTYVIDIDSDIYDHTPTALDALLGEV